MLIGQYGFPIFVAVWLLIKASVDSNKIVEAINGMKEAVIILTTLFEKERLK